MRWKDAPIPAAIRKMHCRKGNEGCKKSGEQSSGQIILCKGSVAEIRISDYTHGSENKPNCSILLQHNKQYDEDSFQKAHNPASSELLLIYHLTFVNQWETPRLASICLTMILASFPRSDFYLPGYQSPVCRLPGESFHYRVNSGHNNPGMMKQISGILTQSLKPVD